MIVAHTTGSRFVAALALGLTTACVAENPDWDAATTSMRGESTAVAAGGDSSSGNGAASSTGNGGAASSTGNSDDDSEAPASDGSDPAEACLVMGVAACGSDAMVVCVDVMTDVSDCGACFADCAAMGGESCKAGACDCPGGPSNRICNGMCTDTRKDAFACGDDCVDCTLEFGAEAECDKGKCKD